MSITFLPNKPIPFSKVKGLDDDVREIFVKDSTAEESACLTDGKNYIWATKSKKGYTIFTAYGLIKNDPTAVLSALMSKFNIKFITEDTDPFKSLLERDYKEDFYIFKI